MAKKVEFKSTATPHPVDNEFVVNVGNVRETPQGARHGNSQTTATQQDPVFPIVDTHILEPVDANDGSEDGEQDSFSTPPFANGRDTRHRG